MSAVRIAVCHYGPERVRIFSVAHLGMMFHRSLVCEAAASNPVLTRCSLSANCLRMLYASLESSTRVSGAYGSTRWTHSRSLSLHKQCSKMV